MSTYIPQISRFALLLVLITPQLAQAAVCRSDVECSNGLFCDGRETCRPGDARANAQGCVPANLEGRGSVCGTGETCDESGNYCRRDCQDADGDGHESVVCGGTDCDDNDASRYPGATEVCDFDGHDEDCDPTTVGRKDDDGDGQVDVRCSNY